MKEELKISTKVAVRQSNLHRYGLFAKEAIEKGEVIEETIFVRTTHRSQNENRDPALHHYSYGINCNCEKCQKEGINFAIPFGYCQFTNHSLEPNAVLVHDYNESVTALTALDDIKEGEEIVMNYGQGFQEWLDKVTEIQENMKLVNSEQTEKFEEGAIKFRPRAVEDKPASRGIKETIDAANELNEEE
jgi:SET domain-containing protein